MGYRAILLTSISIGITKKSTPYRVLESNTEGAVNRSNAPPLQFNLIITKSLSRYSETIAPLLGILNQD